MAVVIETTLGDITVDLYLDQRPVTCLNFLKLCKMKYYNFNLFHSIRSGFIAQTGDPTGEGSGGQSIFGLLEGPEKRFFSGEKMPKIRHADTGLISMVCTGDMMVGSQFFFTLAPDLDSLDGVHCVIGEVTEGHEVLRKLNDVICDETHRPYQDVRITHTIVLEDPFNDPTGLRAPSRSPSPSTERLKGGRIAPDEEIDGTQGKSAAEIQEMIEEKEAKARATILEIVGDLPDADIAPPENVLFVCKLNPVTTDEDLEIIFSRFGTIVSCEVIRDKKTGDSLQYAFIEFSDKKSCEDAYFKMDNVLIDDRRIHVDFSQSVSKMKWLGKGRGVKYFNDNDSKENYFHNNISNQCQNRDRDGQKKRGEHQNNRETHGNIRHENKESERQMRHEHRYDRYEKDRRERSHRDRSRSKSMPERVYNKKSHKNRSSSRSRPEKNQDETLLNDKKTSKTDKNYHSDDKRYSRNSDNNDKQENNLIRHGNSRSYKNRSPDKNDKSESKISPRRYKAKSNKNERNHDGEHHRSGRSKENNNIKRKHLDEENNSYTDNKKSKSEKNILEPRTPSPVLEKGSKKLCSKKKEKAKKVVKRSRNSKKKRKPSTSSSETDLSSSDTDTSSSDEDSSSSSGSSSSSTSSSSDSSTSSSSSSEDERNKRKRRKKIGKSKVEKKPKNKL